LSRLRGNSRSVSDCRRTLPILVAGQLRTCASLTGLAAFQVDSFPLSGGPSVFFSPPFAGKLLSGDGLSEIFKGTPHEGQAWNLKSLNPQPLNRLLHRGQTPLSIFFFP
jgi:hypothetical protein